MKAARRSHMSPPAVVSKLVAEELDLWHQVQELWELSAKNDAERIRAALHPNYMGWDMTAPTPHDREQAVASASGESARLIQYNLEPLSVRLYEGSTGVVHYRYSATVQTKDIQHAQVRGQWTEVYIRQGQRWLMVAVSGRPDPDEGSSATSAMPALAARRKR